MATFLKWGSLGGVGGRHKQPHEGAALEKKHRNGYSSPQKLEESTKIEWYSP